MRKLFLLAVAASLLTIAQPAAANHGTVQSNACGTNSHRSDATTTQRVAGPNGIHVSIWAHDDGYVAVSYNGGIGNGYIEADGATQRVEFSNGNGGTQGRVSGGSVCVSVIGNVVKAP